MEIATEQSADRLLPGPVTLHVVVFSGRSAGQAVCILTVEEEAIPADNSGPVPRHVGWRSLDSWICRNDAEAPLLETLRPELDIGVFAT